MNDSEKQAIDIKIDKIKSLKKELESRDTPGEKLQFLSQLPEIKKVIKHYPLLAQFIDKSPPNVKIALYSLFALAQGRHVLEGLEQQPNALQMLEELALQLLEMEKFYEAIGGIIGYHLTFLELVKDQHQTSCANGSAQYHKPEWFDISEYTSEVDKAVRWGIETLPEIGELYPVGGAGERLSLIEESTGIPKPAGHLPLHGKTLIALMIRDIQAREFLYYKLFNKQVITPIAMMTSHEKNNHTHIYNMLVKEDFFGRPRESFFLFVQPLVPIINPEGNWVVSSPLKLFMKPGGHGAIWKLAQDKGVFTWLRSLKRNKALVRQVNNPAAGIDHGLLVLCGYGIKNHKSMGFSSCRRRVGAHEGMDILIEKKKDQGYEYGITNIEYTDFTSKGIQDVPANPSSKHSAYPANTNILFVDLKAVEEALKKCPIPGILINLKTQCPHSKKIGGRLESTMQNIADGMLDEFKHRIKPSEQKKLRTYITYNVRSKTIIAAKKAYTPGGSLEDTPQGCYLELQENQQYLFSKICKFKLPELGSPEEYLEKGPGFNIHYHPALGPLYSVIGQKVRRGVIENRSEMHLEIAELDVSDLTLSGSLMISTDNVIGKNNGKCTLKNVRVTNKGIDWSADNVFWKNQISRLEILNIVIHGSGEFYAENVEFNGNITIEVQDGFKMTAYMKNGKVQYQEEPISSPTWYWKYAFDENDRVILKKEEH